MSTFVWNLKMLSIHFKEGFGEGGIKNMYGLYTGKHVANYGWVLIVYSNQP